jgi:two-component system, LuxR family, sensor kinase FixL
MSIKLRLALIVFAVAIPMLFMSAMTAWRLADQTRARSRQTIGHAVRPVMIAIDAQLGKYIVAAHALAVSASLKAQDFNSFRDEAEQALPQMPGVWVTLTDPNGRELIDTMLSEAETEKLPPVSRGSDASRLPEMRRMQVSDLQTGTIPNASTISLSQPVAVGDKGDFILSLNVDAIVFRGVLNSQGLSDDVVAEIVDRRGAVIARSRDYEKWIGKLGLVRSQELDNEEMPVETVDSNGKAIIAASATSPLSGWKAVIAAEKSVVDAPIKQVVASTLIIGFATTIMSLAFASVGARRITVPIESLEQGAQALRNHQPVSFSPTGIPELDRAMLAFDSASKSLLTYETERSLAEEALRDSEERLRLLIDGAKDYAIFMLDPQGHVISWNEGAHRTIGYDTNEIVGRHFSTFFTPDQIEAGTPQNSLAEALHSGLLQQDGERIRKDGTLLMVNSLTSVLFSKDGGLKGYAIIIRDITETKLAELALRTSETLLRAVVDGSPDAIIAINGNGVVQSVNGNGIKMFGYERQEIVGSNIKILIPEHYGNHDIHLKGYLQNGRKRILDTEREVEGRRKDGTIFPLGLLVTETVYADTPLFVGFLRDLSSRHEIEARVKQLQGERLSAMGGLAAGLAHELNQPLAAAVTFLETVQLLHDMPAEARSSSLEDTLSSAIDEIMRAGQIMKRLRQFVTTGEPDKTFVNLHNLILDPTSSAVPRKQKTQVEFRLEAPSDRVLADEVQIKQVLGNLIKNAVEAMSPSDNRRLRIATSLSEHGMIRVDVSDTGHGLAPHVLKNLFEPFQTTKQTGIGIGLSISRMIIEAHYGRIWASANPDGGATFSFTLPLASAEPVDERQTDCAFS